MNILIINGSVDKNELDPYWIVPIDTNISIDNIVSILQLPSDYQLVLYDNRQARKVIDINSLTNVLLNDTYPVIAVMDNCSYSIDHYLDSYSQFMLSKMFEPGSVEDITFEATNKFFSSIEDIASKCNRTTKDIINHLLSDPTKFYIVYGILSNHWNIDGDNWNKIYINAAKDGYTPILDKLTLDEKPLSMNTYLEALKQAAGSGNMDIVISMMNHISKMPAYNNKLFISIIFWYNEAMEAAAEGGHIDIVKLMLHPDPDNSNIGANNYNEAMELAAYGGHIDIVELMLQPDPDDSTKGATNYDNVMSSAAEGGHMDIVKLMLHPDPDNYDIGANKYDRAMSLAAREGHIDIVQLMLHPDPDDYAKGATHYNWTMSDAAEAGHMGIVQLMLEQGAYNYDEVMIVAAAKGHTEIINLIQEWRSTH